MLEVLEWVKKHAEGPADPSCDPASAAAWLADLRGADPIAALHELRDRLDSANDAADVDPKTGSEVLALIQEAGAAHVSALLAQYLANRAGTQAARESVWKSLIQYLSRLTPVLCASAVAQLKAAKEDGSLREPSAASAARGLRACRTLAKICLVHYTSVPRKLWRLAYAVHALAEQAGCATSPVSPHSDHKSVTTIGQELLRLLMLQVSAPDMMAPEQIEVADRVIEQLGDDFTLRSPGVADNPFCFDRGGDLPPRRAIGPQAETSSDLRYFGPGTGFDALERIHKQLATARIADIKMFGKDISPQAQLSAVQHLLVFWSAKSPYAPPVHSRAAGNLEVVHRYAQIWQHLSLAQASGGGLTIADAEDGVPQPPETWALRDAGGNELGADLPQPCGGWTKCGELVGISVRGGRECWLGVIRRMHGEPGSSLHADVAVLSREPLAVSLRALLGRGEDTVYSDASSQQFAFNTVRAIILSDGSEGRQPPNLLLPSESWKEGRIYEALLGEPSRYLRGLRVVRRGDDYVRATFEWVSAPGA